MVANRRFSPSNGARGDPRLRMDVIVSTRSDVGDGKISNGYDGSGRRRGLIDDPYSQRDSPANTGRARNRDLDRERAVAEAVWGENWIDIKRTNTRGGGSFDATNE